MKRLLLTPLAASLLLVGCGDNDSEEEVLVLPNALATGWNEITPGGDTICSRGTEFSYFVRKGTVNKVVIDYIGGGACWDALTCGFADALFEETVDRERERIQEEEPTGIYDDQNPANPFKDWYHVVIPYCTGDIHWGDSVTTYNEGEDNAITINHKGAVNSRTVLDWVYDNFSKPEQIFVTGCSAGSYGSALWSSYVMEHYPDSQVFQFGDSGAGIITDDFFVNSFPSWQAELAFPSFIPELDPAENDIQDKHLPDLYAAVANHFTDRWTSQYDTVFDENQHFFYQAMGGGPVEEWSAKMLASITEIESRAENFSAFIAPGEQHCIIPYDNFYTVEANGVKLTDWLTTMLEEGSVASTRCQGADCDRATP